MNIPAMLDVWWRCASLRVAVFAEYIAQRTLLSGVYDRREKP